MHDAPLRIHTARLDLIAATLDHLRAELEAPEQLGPLLGAVVPPSWPPGHYDREAIAFFHARLTESGPAAIGWYGWYAVLRAAEACPATLVASGGYFGPPDAGGTVEIGYSAAVEWRRQGYATELVQALAARALAMPAVRRVVAEVHEENAASLEVMERCDFHRVGPGREPGYHRYRHGAGPAVGEGKKPVVA